MILDILIELGSDNSRLFKEAVLKREKDNELLQKVFLAAYNPLVQYHIRKIPEYTPAKFTSSQTLEWGIDCLDALSQRIYTGNKGIDYLKNVLENLEADDAKVIELIIGKDLKCGASESTANKIWKDLIPEYPCMLASGYSQKLVDKVFTKNGYAIVDLKSDGMRCNAHVTKDGVQFFSRNGKEISSNEYLQAALTRLAGDAELVVDGEMMVWNEDYTKFLSRKEGNGILNKANKGTISQDEADRLCFVVWDYIPLDKFVSGGTWDEKYSDRRRVLRGKVEQLNQDKLVQFIPTHEVKTLDEARIIFNDYLAKGFEGIILKDPNGYWEDKRTKGLIKFKAELECELLVTSIDEGNGKYAGMVGALQCVDASGTLTVGVGTGLTDEDRKRPFSDYIGKIVSVKYNEVITNTKGEKSLFLPVFIEIRLDKNKADVL